MENKTKKTNSKVKSINKPNIDANALILEIKNLKAHITELDAEMKQMTQQYVLNIEQKANIANRMLEEKTQEMKVLEKTKIDQVRMYAFEPAALNLIEIVNQLQSALGFEPQDEKSKKYQAGFKMFLAMLKNLLKDQNVIEIPTSVGEEFDSDVMECLELVDDTDFKDNQVIQILTPGYKLHNRVLKPTLVKVAKRKN